MTVVTEPGILQAEADIVLDHYQPDEQIPCSTPQYRTSTEKNTDNLAQIRKNTANWCDAEPMKMVICMEAHLMDHSLAEENKKKQSSIEEFF